ncbi:peptidyl-tRNA hydrolase Pth2 [Candidatus Aenigmatarchaeota archaeon]
MYKQVIVIRSDVKMSKGKTAVQTAHASLESYKIAKRKNKTKIWEITGQKKVLLKVESLAELKKIKQKCNKLKVPCALIHDAGRTEVKSGTITALGIGPDKEKTINKVTGSLPLVR